MTSRHQAQHRRAGNGPLLIAIGIVLIAVVGGGLLLHSAGVITLPFLSGGEKDEAPVFDRTGKIEVPISIRPIESYSRVVREHILNPKTRTIASVWLRPQDIPEEAAKNAGEVLGRVIRHDKPAGQIFMKTEFFPKGTRPGPTAGIPPGKRAMQLKAAAVPGLHGLKQGDRFDIVMTVEVEIEQPRSRPRREGELEIDGPYGDLANAEGGPPETPRVKRRRAEVKLIVENGLVVKPVFRRQEVTEKGSLLRGTTLQQKPIEELIIAVEPGEVSALNQSLAIGAHLQVAMRSGQVGDDGTEVDEGTIPDIAVEFEEPDPTAGSGDETGPPKVRIVEIIVGGEKRLLAVPEDEKDKGSSGDGDK